MSLSVIAHVLGVGKFRNFFLIFGVSYALAYMFWTGMITYLPDRSIASEALKTFKLPYFWVFSGGPLGQYPALLWIPSKNWVISINLSAAVFSVTIFTLTSLIATLLLYASRCAGSNCLRQVSPGFLGSFAAIFGVFACCGGGLMVATLGYTIFAFLSEHSILVTWTSIALLFSSVILVSMRLNAKIKANSETHNKV